MALPIQVSASILCANFARIEDDIRRAEAAGVDLFHVDVMDGHFVPNITVGPLMVEAIRPLTKLPIDAHLMIARPWEFIDHFIGAGADIISLHAECYARELLSLSDPAIVTPSAKILDLPKLRADLVKIKAAGCRVFIVLNPGTPANVLTPVLSEIDGVLVMSVNPGFAKQRFMDLAVPKIEELHQVFKKDIAVDGGINAESAPVVVAAGANVLATASYFFGAKDPRALVGQLKELSSRS